MTSFPFHGQLPCRATTSAFRSNPKRRSAFTLIETALALGIVAFALVPVIALLPIGLQTSKSASDLSISAQIAQRLAGMIQQTDEPLAKLADGTSTLMGNYYYFDGEGQPVSIVSSPGGATGVPTNAVYSASIQRLRTGSTGTLADSTGAATLQVQIVNDPGHRMKGSALDNPVPNDLQNRVVTVPVYFVNNITNNGV